MFQHTARLRFYGRHGRIHKLLVSSELLCYIADIPFSASYPLGTKRTEIKSDRGETLKKKKLAQPWNNVAYAHAPYMTRSLARARSTARWLFRLFSRHISGTQSFQENRHININLLVVHNPLVPLIGRPVARSARTRADRRTDRQTDKQTKYRNPRCACALRVNNQFVRYVDKTYAML